MSRPRIRRNLGGLCTGLVAWWLPLVALALSPDMRLHQFESATWSIQQGLPQVTVLATVQGPDGYIWTGTQAGLSRFDGTRFQLFDPDRYPALPTRLTRSLYVDSQARLWVGTQRGAAYWHGGEFHAVVPDDGRAIDVLQFAETDDGEVLIASGSGLWRWRHNKLEQRDDDPHEALWSVFHRRGETLVGGRGYVTRHRGGHWRREALPPLANDAVIRGFAHYDGGIWAASSRGLLYRENGSWQRFDSDPALRQSIVEVIYRDRADTLWVGINGQLLRLRGRRVIDRFDGGELFADGNVLSITEDHEGNLWLGSRSYGLSRWWNGYALRFSQPEGLHQALTWTLAPDSSGALWVGTADGLARFAQGRFETVVTGAQQPHPHAYSLLPEPDRIWVGTRSGLYWWWRRDQRIERPRALSALNGYQINAIVRRDDGYWLAGDSGIWRWDGRRLEQLLPADTNSDHQTRILLQTRDDRLLAGTLGGILEYRPGEGFRQLPGLARRHAVQAMLELEDGRLLAGTHNEKLLVHHRGQWRSIGAADGLPSNASFALLEHAGHIWVAGNRGLFRIPRDSFDAFLNGEADTVETEMILSERGDEPGAQKTPCCNGAGNARAALLDSAMWFPTRDGLVNVHTDRIRRNPHPPGLRIDRVRVGGQWLAAGHRQPLQLASDQRDLDIGFTALSFQDPGSVRMQYRLLGYQDTWQSLDDPLRRVAYYTNLPPGELRFEVRGSNNVGVWSPEPATLTIHVAPRWYETAAVRGLAGAGTLLVLAAVLRLNTRRMAQREKQLSQLVAERTEELRIANTHLQEYSRQLKTTSLTDPLTGLWNRRYLNEHIVPELWDFQQRQLVQPGAEDQCMLVALLDIDLFKRINDQFGHDGGDQILTQFADCLRALVHPRDHVLRWGGEEFMIVFQPLPESEMAGIAQRIIRSLRQRSFSLDSGRELKLTCSVGLSRFPPVPGDGELAAWEQAVALADKALYQVKHSGRDDWCLVEALSPLGDHLDDGLETLEATARVRVQRGRPSSAAQ